jgi:hypothetical protein
MLSPISTVSSAPAVQTAPTPAAAPAPAAAAPAPKADTVSISSQGAAKAATPVDGDHDGR